MIVDEASGEESRRRARVTPGPLVCSGRGTVSSFSPAVLRCANASCSAQSPRHGRRRRAALRRRTSVPTFIVAGIALGGPAWAIGIGTEVVGGHVAQLSPGAAVDARRPAELFWCLLALSAGEAVVASSRSSAAVGDAARPRPVIVDRVDGRRRPVDALRREAAERHGHAAPDGGVHHRPAGLSNRRRPRVRHRSRSPSSRRRACSASMPRGSGRTCAPRIAGRAETAAASTGVRHRHPRRGRRRRRLRLDWFVAALDPAVRAARHLETFTGS